MTAPTSTPARGTRQLVAVAELSNEAKALLGADEPEPPAFVGQLVEGELYADAVRFLAHALPKRESVWWAWVASRNAAGAEPAPLIKSALEATERWIVQPTEEHRRAAMAAGEAAEFGTAAGCAALAAFMSGGSMAPPENPAVPPGEFMTAKAVAGSVTLAAVTKPDQMKAQFTEFVRVGLEVAERTKLWAPK
jgi:hypothetical protein